MEGFKELRREYTEIMEIRVWKGKDDLAQGSYLTFTGEAQHTSASYF